MNQNIQPNTKQPYNTPVLKKYGTVKEITLGSIFEPLGSNGQCPPGLTPDDGGCVNP